MNLISQWKSEQHHFSILGSSDYFICCVFVMGLLFYWFVKGWPWPIIMGWQINLWWNLRWTIVTFNILFASLLSVQRCNIHVSYCLMLLSVHAATFKMCIIIFIFVITWLSNKKSLECLCLPYMMGAGRHKNFVDPILSSQNIMVRKFLTFRAQILSRRLASLALFLISYN